MTLLDHARAASRSSGAAQEAHEKDAKQGLLVHRSRPRPGPDESHLVRGPAALLPRHGRAWPDDCPSLDVGGLVVGDAPSIRLATLVQVERRFGRNGPSSTRPSRNWAALVRLEGRRGHFEGLCRTGKVAVATVTGS